MAHWYHFSVKMKREHLLQRQMHFIPRENPRALFVHPIEKWPPRANTMKQSLSKDESAPARENGKAAGQPSAPAKNGSAAENHDGKSDDETHTGGTSVQASFGN